MINRILLIEDEADFRQIHADLLRSEGYTVLEAKTGEEGRQMANSEKPEVILMDMVMPGTNGLDLLKELREKPETKAVPIFMFSVISNKEAVERAEKLGATGYLVKGEHTADDLLEKLRGLKDSLPHKEVLQ